MTWRCGGRSDCIRRGTTRADSALPLAQRELRPHPAQTRQAHHFACLGRGGGLHVHLKNDPDDALGKLDIGGQLALAEIELVFQPDSGMWPTSCAVDPGERLRRRAMSSWWI